MAYEDLSLRERAAIIKTAVHNGYRHLPDIVDAYNKFDKGGYINNKPINFSNKVDTRMKLQNGIYQPVTREIDKRKYYENQVRKNNEELIPEEMLLEPKPKPQLKTIQHTIIGDVSSNNNQKWQYKHNVPINSNIQNIETYLHKNYTPNLDSLDNVIFNDFIKDKLNGKFRQSEFADSFMKADGGFLNKKDYNVGDLIDSMYEGIEDNIFTNEWLGKRKHNYNFAISKEEALAKGLKPDTRGHFDDIVKFPSHPTHSFKGKFSKDGSIFFMTDKGMEDPNFTLFGMADNGDDQTTMVYNNGTVLPEITVTPTKNYIFNPYDNIKIKNTPRMNMKGRRLSTNIIDLRGVTDPSIKPDTISEEDKEFEDWWNSLDN